MVCACKNNMIPDNYLYCFVSNVKCAQLNITAWTTLTLSIDLCMSDSMCAYYFYADQAVARVMVVMVNS